MKAMTATIIAFVPKPSHATWRDAAFEVAKWQLDTFERFWGLSRPTAKLIRFPERKGKP